LSLFGNCFRLAPTRKKTQTLEEDRGDRRKGHTNHVLRRLSPMPSYHSPSAESTPCSFRRNRCLQLSHLIINTHTPASETTNTNLVLP
jgi:hypothetical protein